MWLLLQLALFVAAGLLGLHHADRWHLTASGIKAAHRAAIQPVQTEEIAAAFTAELQALSRPLDWATIAGRLGVPVALVNEWADDAVYAGYAIRRGGHTYLSPQGRKLLSTASPLRRPVTTA